MKMYTVLVTYVCVCSYKARHMYVCTLIIEYLSNIKLAIYNNYKYTCNNHLAFRSFDFNSQGLRS